MGREKNTGRSDICAQKASMVPYVRSQDFVPVRKLNDSRAEITKDYSGIAGCCAHGERRRVNAASRQQVRQVGVPRSSSSVVEIGECNEESDPARVGSGQ